VHTIDNLIDNISFLGFFYMSIDLNDEYSGFFSHHPLDDIDREG